MGGGGRQVSHVSHKPFCLDSATPAGTSNMAVVGHPKLSGGTDVEQSTSEQ